jgi:hypothetical protein
MHPFDGVLFAGAMHGLGRIPSDNHVKELTKKVTDKFGQPATR